jgi:drug/metabolite transporter (DMT)-like permease
VLSALFLGRRIGGREVAALAVSYAGVVLVFGQDLKLAGDSVALGTGLVFASAVSYAVYLVMSGQWVKSIGAMRLTGWAGSVACLFCIAHFLLFNPAGDPLVAAQVAEPVLWLSLLNATACTVAPVWMVMMAIERIGPALTAQTGMVGPMSTIAMGVFFLGEPFTPLLVAGTVLVLAGVWLLARAKR